MVDVREQLAKRGIALSPTPMAWDHVFGELKKDGRVMAIVATLSDGRRVGGFWAEDPFASSYPADEDLFITVPCLIDQDTGQIRERVLGATGLLVKRSDILLIEFFEPNEAVDATLSGKHRAQTVAMNVQGGIQSAAPTDPHGSEEGGAYPERTDG